MGKGYCAISITDPGNADHVITVGSTHRRDPHLYGVSYFSARGPTGDGRRKPDLLAPGKRSRPRFAAGAANAWMAHPWPRRTLPARQHCRWRAIPN